MATQDAYVAEAKAQLDRLNAEIKKLRAEAEATHSEGKAELSRRLEDLRTQREKAEVELDRLRSASAEAWTDMKDAFEKARHALADGIDKARNQYARS